MARFLEVGSRIDYRLDDGRVVPTKVGKLQVSFGDANGDSVSVIALLYRLDGINEMILVDQNCARNFVDPVPATQLNLGEEPGYDMEDHVVPQQDLYRGKSE